MKNRIGYLIASAGVSLGVAAVMLAGGSATAAQCNIDIAQNICQTTDCVVAHESDCSGQKCIVAVGSTCDECVIASGSDCEPDPSSPPDTTPPPAVQTILDSIKTGDN